MLEIGRLLLITLQYIGVFRAIDGFCTNDEALNAYAESLPVLSCDPAGRLVDSKSRVAIEHLRSAQIKDIRDAGAVYRRQMLVVSATLVEVMIRDYLVCLFEQHPERMYDYVQPHGNAQIRGKVDLNEIIDAKSHNELLTRLAARASGTVAGLSYEKMLKAVSRLSRLDLENRVAQSCLAVLVQRNEIVHEDYQDEVTSEQVEQAFDAAYGLLRNLGQLAIHNGVSIDDPGGLVSESGPSSTQASATKL